MLGRNSLYDFNIGTVKQLGDNKLKVTLMSACRVAGYEAFEDKQVVKKNSVNTEKLSNNLSRAKSKVNELALCNPWDYFVTLTIDKTKYDRYNLKSYYKDFSEFIHNLNKRRPKEDKIVYLLIPEMHEDGAWHMHGLVQGLRDNDLYVNQNGYLSWEKYDKKFGYISLDHVKDKDKVSNYIVKYITKDVDKNVKELGCHLYYSSKGLKTAETLYRGHLELLCDWDYEHPEGYCKVKTFDIEKDNYTDYLILR